MLMGFSPPNPGAAAAKDFPVIASAASTTGFGTSLVCTVPSGIVAGDLLLLFVGGVAAPGLSPTIGASGWTSLYNKTNGNVVRYCFYKVATGTNTITVTSSYSGDIRVYYLRITGASSPPQAGVAVSGTGATANPPSLTPSGGTDKYLWLTDLFVNNIAAGYTPNTTVPSGFTDQLENSSSGVYGESTQATAKKTSEVSNLDPGTYGISSGLDAYNYYCVNTLAISPA